MKDLKLYIRAGLGVLLASVCGLLIMNSPDQSSMIFVSIMSAFVVFGYYFGIFMTMSYGHALLRARAAIEDARSMSSNNTWEYIKRLGVFFRNEKLDAEFARYKRQVNQQQANQEDVILDIDTVIDQTLLEALTKKSLVKTVPNTLTGLGILGTFVGLLSGISQIGFTSVDAIMDSFSGLLSNISLAFYTSICGVVLSTMFDWLYRFCWEDLQQELLRFHREFHSYIILSEEEQILLQKQAFYEKVLTDLSEKNVPEIVDKL